jgi:hypothetical protein
MFSHTNRNTNKKNAQPVWATIRHQKNKRLPQTPALPNRKALGLQRLTMFIIRFFLRKSREFLISDIKKL